MPCLFYRGDSRTECAGDPVRAAGYCCRIWRPSLGWFLPPGTRLFPYGVWAVMHFARGFSNRDYGVLLISENQRVVHRSGVFPGFFRFPFMSPNDLQIGDIWTDPSWRGRGMAVLAIRQIIGSFGQPRRAFWYIADIANSSSIRVAEKAGLVLVGAGEKRARLGVRALGAYEIVRSKGE